MASEKVSVDESEKQVGEGSGEVEASEIGEKAEEPENELGNEKGEENEGQEDQKEGDLGEEEEEDKEVGEDEEVKEEQEDDKGNEEESEDGNKDEDDEEEEQEKIVKKRSRKEKKSETGDLKSPRTPGIERPTRERKTVDRFMAETPRVSLNKTLSIEKGQGTQLKDIPNVAFKLSKRKADENLQLLHSILFGKKSKAHLLKKNIGLFSGFVWVENEKEKQRTKVKEKIEKCVKEKLLDFCDVLNISVSRTTSKKEDLSAKLLEFLESPHATTDSLLADKEKGKKRKSKSKSSSSKRSSSSNATVGRSAKKQKVDSESSKKRKLSTEEDDDKSEPSESEDSQDDDSTVPVAESEHEEINSEGGTDEDEPKRHTVVEKESKKSAERGLKSGAKSNSVGAGSPEKASKTDKPTKKSSSSVSKKEAEPKGNTMASSTKKKKVVEKSEDSKVAIGTSSSKNKSSKSSTKVSEKDQEEKCDKEPTREEMLAVVTDMLKEVDFNTATLSDILRKLGKHFERDLMHRKAEVKQIITEVINNMSDDEDEEAESEDDEV